jgi:CubicO group peptidase (beta-lactamase class C family)
MKNRTPINTSVFGTFCFKHRNNKRDLKATLFTLFCGVFSMNSIADAATTAAKANAYKAIDAELSAVVNNPAKPLASLSVLAVRDGKVVYQQQFGSKWIDNDNPANNKPADRETMYRIASISKTVTTLGVMKLVEAGKLKLDQDVSDYLGYKLRNPNFPDDAITLRMLLNHTSTLRDDAGYFWDAKSNTDLKDVLLPGGKLYGKGDMWAKTAKPGAYFQYANFPWGVIGTIMERATNERFDRLMKRLVLDPLNLKGGFHPADLSAKELANVATLYRKRSVVDKKEVWNTEGPWVAQVDDYVMTPPEPRALPDYVIGTNGTLFGPQGNCRLSADGLSTILLMLMNRGVHQGKVFLKTKTVDEMLKTQWRANADGKNGETTFGGGKDLFNAWGLGVQQFTDVSHPDAGKGGGGDRLVEQGGYTAIGHLGDAWGLTSAMVFNAKTKSGMIFMHGGPGFNPDTNPGKYSAMYRHEEEILNALYVHAIAGSVAKKK